MRLKNAGDRVSIISYQETVTLTFRILNKQYQTITEQKDLTWISKSIFLGLLTNVCQYNIMFNLNKKGFECAKIITMVQN